MKRRITEEWVIFCLAVQFLTRLPVGRGVEWSPERMAATPRWYGAVGMLVGAISALVFWLAALALPPVVAVLLAVVAGVMATGALHEDGFADCCDGLGGAADRDRVLEIMRDSRVGTYGVLGLGLLMTVKVAALTALPATVVPLALVAGHALSRASMVVAIATSAYIRAEGTGKSVSASRRDVWIASGTGIVAALPLMLVADESVIALGLVGTALGHMLMRYTYERRLGGHTGDCLGAVQQSSETGCYLFLAVALA